MPHIYQIYYFYIFSSTAAILEILSQLNQIINHNTIILTLGMKQTATCCYSYKESLAILFRNFIHTFDTVSLVSDQTMWRNKKKQLEGEYRRFQAEGDVDVGTILYYNHKIEKLKRILDLQDKLEQPRKLGNLNPFIKRFHNYQSNKRNRSKFDMSEFINS